MSICTVTKTSILQLLLLIYSNYTVHKKVNQSATNGYTAPKVNSFIIVDCSVLFIGLLWNVSYNEKIDIRI